MNELEVYRKLYGELIECVPHYEFRLHPFRAFWQRGLWDGITIIDEAREIPTIALNRVADATKKKEKTMGESKRFNYVRYDETSIKKQEAAKQTCEALESQIDALPDGRAKSLAYTKLEECYMWVGKAIRDDQVARDSQPEHRPERGE